MMQKFILITFIAFFTFTIESSAQKLTYKNLAGTWDYSDPKDGKISFIFSEDKTCKLESDLTIKLKMNNVGNYEIETDHGVQRIKTTMKDFGANSVSRSLVKFVGLDSLKMQLISSN